jgi:hypothetical protein
MVTNIFFAGAKNTLIETNRLDVVFIIANAAKIKADIFLVGSNMRYLFIFKSAVQGREHFVDIGHCTIVVATIFVIPGAIHKN